MATLSALLQSAEGKPTDLKSLVADILTTSKPRPVKVDTKNATKSTPSPNKSSMSIHKHVSNGASSNGKHKPSVTPKRTVDIPKISKHKTTTASPSDDKRVIDKTKAKPKLSKEQEKMREMKKKLSRNFQEYVKMAQNPEKAQHLKALFDKVPEIKVSDEVLPKVEKTSNRSPDKDHTKVDPRTKAPKLGQKGKRAPKEEASGPQIWCARCSKMHGADLHSKKTFPTHTATAAATAAAGSKPTQASPAKRPVPLTTSATAAPRIRPPGKTVPLKRPRQEEEDEYEDDFVVDDEEEDDGFIDDGDEGADYRSEIRKMFKYDPTRYRDEDDDDANMEVSLDRIMAEEKRSAKLAAIEDARELELIQKEEEEERKRKRLKKNNK